MKRQNKSRRLKMRLESTIASLDKAQSLIIQFAEQADYGEEDCRQIGLAVRECVANAVLHGNQSDAKKKVSLNAEIRWPVLEISVTDEGKGFDVSAVPDPFEEANMLRESGRGLSLIRALMDEVKIRRTPGGTELTMSKCHSSHVMKAARR